MKKIILLLIDLFSSNAVIAGEKEMKPFIEVTVAVKYVRSYKGLASELKLPISNQLNDAMGMNMTIILDYILNKGFEPDGFEQKDGYRVYKYK